MKLGNKITDLLRNYGSMTVNELSTELDVSVSTVRRELKPLIDDGIVEVDRSEKPFKYSLTKETVTDEQFVVEENFVVEERPVSDDNANLDDKFYNLKVGEMFIGRIKTSNINEAKQFIARTLNIHEENIVFKRENESVLEFKLTWGTKG